MKESVYLIIFSSCSVAQRIATLYSQHEERPEKKGTKRKCEKREKRTRGGKQKQKENSNWKAFFPIYLACFTWRCAYSLLVAQYRVLGSTVSLRSSRFFHFSFCWIRSFVRSPKSSSQLKRKTCWRLFSSCADDAIKYLSIVYVFWPGWPCCSSHKLPFRIHFVSDCDSLDSEWRENRSNFTLYSSIYMAVVRPISFTQKQ